MRVIYSKVLLSGFSYSSGLPLYNDEVIETIDDVITKQLDTSTRKISKILNLCHVTMRNVLKKYTHLKLYIKLNAKGQDEPLTKDALFNPKRLDLMSRC